MKKAIINVLFALVVFLGFDISANAATINFRRGTGGPGNNLGSMTITDVDTEVPITIATPTRDGYRFNGWSNNGSSRVVIDNVNNTIKITQSGDWNRNVDATWLQLYNINYNLSGGSVDPENPTQYATGDNITLTNPTRNGYDFTGWTGTGLGPRTMSVTIPTNATGNRNYTAHWQRHDYDLNVDLNGGSITGSIPTTYHIQSAAITLPTPTPQDGFTFAGWTGTDLDSPTMNVTIPTGSYGDRSYIANYNPIDYAINYSLDNGSITSAPTSYNAVTGATIPNPTRDGYNFMGWIDDTGANLGIDLVISNTERGDKNLTATWQIINYDLYYALNEGVVTEENPTNYTVETETFTLNNPEKEGYDFTGWTGSYLEKETVEVTIEKGSTGSRRFIANYAPTVYKISYNLQGGEVTENPDSYTIESPEIILNNPTKEGYEFIGWEGTGLTEPTMTVIIPTGSTGSRRYIALWKEIIPEETTGEGTSDLDEVLPISNPQTGDNILLLSTMFVGSALGIIVTRKKRFN